MARIDLSHISYRYGSNDGVEDISFAVEEGEVAALVGASGSGKTTILKLISGFLQPQQGSIRIGKDEVASAQASVQPARRGVGLVFQSHALFPHLSVEKNILFGAKSKDVLAGLLTDFHLEGLGNRYPHELSGGQQQRVALARALAANPRALLLDEPFASIDAALRRKIRSECIGLLKQKRVTSLLVTHDAEEAMELAERIFVIEAGRIVQSGSAAELYRAPVSAYVASLFGDVNVLDGEAASILGGTLLRPDALLLGSDGLPGNIVQVHYRGTHYTLHVALESGAMLKVFSAHGGYGPGEAVYVRAGNPLK